MTLTNEQITNAMIDTRSGTYRNTKSETEVIVAYVDGVPYVLGWIGREVLRAAPQYILAEFKREIWDKFRRGQLDMTMVRPSTGEAQP